MPLRLGEALCEYVGRYPGDKLSPSTDGPDGIAAVHAQTGQPLAHSWTRQRVFRMCTSSRPVVGTDCQRKISS